MRNSFAAAMRAAHPLALAARMPFLAASAVLLALAAASCAPQQPAKPAPPPPQAKAAPQTGVAFLGTLAGKNGEPLTGHDIRNTPPFSTAYRALLRRNKLKDGWLTHFNGPATPVRTVAIGGAEYLFVRGCKPQSCTAHTISILYSEKEKATYALLKQNGESLWLGEPPDDIKQAFGQIERLEPPK